MRKPVLITTPFPTTEEVARAYGVSRKRMRELQQIGAAIFEQQKREAAAKRKARKQSAAAKRNRSTATSRE